MAARRIDPKRRHHLLALGIVVGALSLAACGGGSSAKTAAGATSASKSSSQSSGSSSSSAAAVHACDVVTVDQLTTTLGREVILDPDGSNDVTCAYLTTARPQIVFSIAASPARSTVEEMRAVDGTTPLDIGDGGYIFANGAQIGFIKNGIEYQVNLGPFDPATNETLLVARLIEANA
jgi:hypothetical protein